MGGKIPTPKGAPGFCLAPRKRARRVRRFCSFFHLGPPSDSSMKKFLILFALCATTASAQRFQVADQFKIVSVSDPQLAPDGKSILCVVSRPNAKDNRHDAELVLVEVATGAQRVLTAADRRGVTAPRWAADGRTVAFLATGGTEVGAKRQVFVLPMAGGESRRLTSVAQGVQQFAWSPDGKTIAFVTSDAPAKKPDEEKNNLSFELGHDAFLTTSAALPSHVWLVPTDGGAARRLTSGSWSVPIAHPPGPAPSPLAWSPDGQAIAITHLESPHSGDADIGWIELVDVASGAARKLTGHTHSESFPVFSPEGKNVSYSFLRDGTRTNFNDTWVTPVTGGEGTNLTKHLDINIARAVWMADGKSLIAGGRIAAGVGLWQVPAVGGGAKRIELGAIEPWCGYWLDVTTSADGALAFTGLTSAQPRELYYMASVDALPRRLTKFNDGIAALQLGKSERITWDFEGFHEDGVLVYPPDFDAKKKYPLALYIHGGPRSSSTLTFSTIPQLFAAQGWVVFQPNYRGSDNLGQAYAVAITRDAGAGPGRDVMAGLEAVKRKGFVDESRIVVGGWSYGGYMTTWLIGNYPIFRAAVAGAPVTSWLDQYTLGDANVRRAYGLGGSPYTDPARMKLAIEQSPITYAPRVKTPTLIMSDTGDVRVPITQSFQYYHALRDNGVPVKFIAFPVAGHSPEDPVHLADITRRYVEWFAQYLK